MTIDTLSDLYKALERDVPDFAEQTSGELFNGDIVFPTSRWKMGRIWIENGYRLDPSPSPTEDGTATYENYATLRCAVDLLMHHHRKRFMDAAPIARLVSEVDSLMQGTGWSIEGQDTVDGAIAGWMHSDYDRACHDDITDLAIMRVEIADSGEVSEVSVLATGEGYQPFEEDEFWGDDLATQIADWFRDRLDAYGQLPEGA